MKEILLRGFDRWGLNKACAYLPEMDQFEKGHYSAVFLNQSITDGFSLKTYFPYLQMELDAWGLRDCLKLHENSIEAEIPGSIERLVLYVFSKNYGLEQSVSFKQIPLPYESVFIRDLPEKSRKEIQKGLEKELKEQYTSVREKKSSKPKKAKAEKSDEILQLSLFDF